VTIIVSMMALPCLSAFSGYFGQVYARAGERVYWQPLTANLLALSGSHPYLPGHETGFRTGRFEMKRYALRLATRLTTVCAALIVMSATSVTAQTARQITWEDLAPVAAKPLEDPFAHLEPVLAAKLYGIASVLRQKEQGFLSEVSPEYEMVVETTHELEGQGVEVDALLRRFDEIEAEAQRQDRTVVHGLDGQFVRMPGYALPLELEGAAIQEFLLVPYVGACIHVPPPPQNQMVFVKLAEPYVATDLFTPVWITGRMTIKRAEKIVPLSDGKAPVTAGYTVEAAKVEAYRE
jgi:uncharacterized protein